MHHVSYRGVFEMRASLKHLFSLCCCAEIVPQTTLYTRRDEEQKKTTTQYLIRITVQIQVHAHNESQLPNILVSVTTLLQCSVVYMGNFFSTYECQRKKEQKMSSVLRADNYCLVWAPLSSWTGFVFTQKSTIPCPSVLVAFGPSQCPLKVK